MRFFLAKFHIFWYCIKNFDTITTVHQKGNIFVAIGTSGCLPRLKIAFLAQKKAILGKWCQKTGSQSSQTGTYRKTEIIQSYLRTWGSHWVRSVWGKIRWLYGRSIGRNWFLGRKCSFLVQNPFFLRCHPIYLLPSWCYTKNFVLSPLHGGPQGGRWCPFLAQKFWHFF